MSLRNTISRHLQNIPGSDTGNRKLLCIESDDWGGIRMAVHGARERLHDAGIPVMQDHYNKLDHLESSEDLEALRDMMLIVQNKTGKRPVITANVTTANPDFAAIRRDEFEVYHCEPFVRTLENYWGASAWSSWQELRDESILDPQYHGRDHLHQLRWMSALRSGEEHALAAFQERVFGIMTRDDSPEYYMAAYDYQPESGKQVINSSLLEGLTIFEDAFGHLPDSFIAPCYIWDERVEAALLGAGVYGFQGKIIQLKPRSGAENRTYSKVYRRSGRKQNKRIDLVRNVFFEPAARPGFPWIRDAMNRIAIAFSHRKPAVISSHRVNYMGRLEESNRRTNLQLLHDLLLAVHERWPDVEFMSGSDLVKYYQTK